MKKYEHGGDIYNNSVRLDFSVNTNPLGISDRVREAVISGADAFGVYPDADYAELRRVVAEHEGVKSENILCSNGASEMIFAAVRAVMPKRALLIAPTFSEYERAFLSVGCEIEYYTLKEENEFIIGSDFIAGLKSVDMAFICNPNNPAGNIADRALTDKIADVCAERNIICIIDECFMDLADNGYSMKGKMPVIKAFTKTYAMAGLRLGYIIGDTKICGDIKKQLPAWNVSAAAQAGGIAALNDGGYIEKSRIYIKREREFLTEELRKLGFKAFKSDTNFILIKGQSGIGERLLERGILIRSCTNFRGLDESFYRVAVKAHTDNAELIRELGDICG